MKKVLFIANPCQDLYKDIEAELILQGYIVYTVIDRQFPYDPNFRKTSLFGTILRPLKRYLWRKQIYKYWEKCFNENGLLDHRYDVLFIISGVSIDNKIIQKISSVNPGIKKILYTWDSCNYYNFERFFPIMDKCFTFDIEDVKKNRRWSLLPIFYTNGIISKTIKYDFFLIGSNHDGRYSFVKKIMPQLHQKGYSSFIKIVGREKKLSFMEKIFIFFNTKEAKQLKEEVNFSKGMENDECLSRNGYSILEYKQLLSASRCVIDDQRDCQSGLTARFIWALAQDKIIFTTNIYALEYSFVNPRKVVIISKTNPTIDFIPETQESNLDMTFLRIDNWLKTILS